MDDSLKNRIWNKFYDREFISDDHGFSILEKSLTNIEKMMDKMGIVYQYPENCSVRRENTAVFRKYLLTSDKWYLMYDFVEKYLELLSKKEKKTVIAEYNRLFEEEVSGYRIVNGMIVSIVSEIELQAITKAAITVHDAVNKHLSKALSLFANRKMPDYENSIKESICAVEALCKIIVDDDSATLGKALRKLESKGIQLHQSFQVALDKLYGYTSDEKGIRHAGTEIKNAPPEDARFMLVICSAFVNFLIEKLEKSSKMEV